MTTTPFVSGKRVQSGSYSSLLKRLIRNYSSILRLIDQRSINGFNGLIKEVIDHPDVNSTIKYWKQKLEQYLLEKYVIEGFLFSKLLEIGAFSYGKEQYHNQIKNKHPEQNTSILYSTIPEKNSEASSSRNTICFVIPVRISNKKHLHFFKRMFASLEDQNKPISKVIVIDDASPIKIEIPRLFSSKVDIYSTEQQSGPAVARNWGSKIALEEEYDIIVFSDYDMFFPSSWADKLSQMITISDASIFSGINLAYSSTWWDFYHDINGTLNGRIFPGTQELLYSTTAAVAVKSEVIERLRFNEDFYEAAGEDIDFSLRARINGFKLNLISDLKAYHDYGYVHDPLLDLKTFLKRCIRYGSAEPTIISLHESYYSDLSNTIEISGLTSYSKINVPYFLLRDYTNTEFSCKT